MYFLFFQKQELGTNFVADSYDDLPLMELEIKLRQEVEELQQQKEKRLELVQKFTDMVNFAALSKTK